MQDHIVSVRFVSVPWISVRFIPVLGVCRSFLFVSGKNGSLRLWFLLVLVVPIKFRFRFIPVPGPNAYFWFRFFSVRAVSVSFRFGCSVSFRFPCLPQRHKSVGFKLFMDFADQTDHYFLGFLAVQQLACRFIQISLDFHSI